MSHPTPPQDTTEQLAQRIEQLEIKLSYAEDLLDTLNALVTRQQDQIDRLMAEVAELRRRREDEPGGGFRSLRDELPPHY